jgi:hypothetical protein
MEKEKFYVRDRTGRIWRSFVEPNYEYTSVYQPHDVAEPRMLEAMSGPLIKLEVEEVEALGLA